MSNPDDRNDAWLAALLAETIRRIRDEESVSSLYVD